MPTLIAAARKSKYEQLIVVAVHYRLTADGYASFPFLDRAGIRGSLNER
jgi:hypothetical protein